VSPVSVTRIEELIAIMAGGSPSDDDCVDAGCALKEMLHGVHAQVWFYLQTENKRLKDEIADYELSAKIHAECRIRAVERWQQAHPGNDLMWPDGANLLVWLMDQVAPQRRLSESPQPVTNTDSDRLQPLVTKP
jgi:hypothetical protein